MSRAFWVFVHRWAGLTMTVFLIVVGLTGSLLAFKTDIERLICPRIYATPEPGVPQLDLAALAERAQALVPRGQVVTVMLTAPDQALVVFEPRRNPATGKPYELGFDQLFLDPWTGMELGRRLHWGDISEGPINFMPFVYSLHESLLLNSFGAWALGIVALIWTIDCFIGFYLTLPVKSGAFWHRWRPSWLVKRKAGAFRLNFDLHRAGGLWVWAVLFVFAWSSVMLNLSPVYDSVTRAVFDYVPLGDTLKNIPQHPGEIPRLSFRDAQTVGRRLMAEQAHKVGFTVQSETIMYCMQGAYFYFVKSTRDIRDRLPLTYVIFDQDTGKFIALVLPTGEHSGNTVSSWLYALHMADVFGFPYRIFVCVLGLVITMLSVTGVYIWYVKRRARMVRKAASAIRAAELRAKEIVGQTGV